MFPRSVALRAVAVALVLARLAPPVLQWTLRRTRHGLASVPLFTAARLVHTGARVLPVVVVVVRVIVLVRLTVHWLGSLD